MKMLGNYLDLKPIANVNLSPHANTDDPFYAGGSADFYNTHYPLLLRKKNFNDEEEKAASETKVVSWSLVFVVCFVKERVGSYSSGSINRRIEVAWTATKSFLC
jgi:hypothetical protein